MNVTHEVAGLRDALRAAGSADRARSEKRYLKSDLEFLGTPVPSIRAIVRDWKRSHPDISRREIVRVAEALWSTRTHELRSAGVGLLELYRDWLQASDISLVERLIGRANTWAHVDWLAVKVAGSLAERYPAAAKVLPRWAQHESFWIRRASMLALLDPLRAGGGDFALFARLAASMAQEKEFFIRKAIGWILREVGKRRPGLTYQFLSEHIDTVSGLTLREGAKYLPPSQRADLLEQRRARLPRR
jgi:3-methyladenine DNA glycosylase AlkD